MNQRSILSGLIVFAWLACGDNAATGASGGSGGNPPQSGGGPDGGGPAGGNPATGGSTTGGGGEAPATSCEVPDLGPPSATFRVTPTGDDANDCSDASPCRTLQRAADVAATAGSLVLVEDGEYVGFRSVFPDVTFRAAGDSVLINSGFEGAMDNINVEGTDRVRIEGFKVSGAVRAGIRVVTSVDCVVRDNVIEGSGMWGVLTGFAPRVLIVGNRTSGSVVEHGIYVGNSDVPNDDPVICGNESFGNNGNGIQINGDCEAGGDGVITGAIVESNRVHDNGLKALSLISAPGVRVTNNLLYDNALTAGAAAIHLVNQTSCSEDQATSGAVVANNTVVEPNMAAVRMNDGAKDNLVFNNILVSNNPYADDVGLSFESNNLMLGEASSLGFNADFRPTLGGPATDGGLAEFMGGIAPTFDYLGAPRPLGASHDLGAYEIE
jgi:hypothetical protein